MSGKDDKVVIPLITNVYVGKCLTEPSYYLVTLNEFRFRMPRYAADKLAENIRCVGILRDHSAGRGTNEELALSSYNEGERRRNED